jgi:DNA-binding GntR family transcriptional regulator
MLGTGRFKPGQPLIQGELAEALGVSTMPVREALLRLNAEGLVVSGSNRRFAVASYTPDELRDTFWTYSMLQGELSRRACLRGDRGLLVEVLASHHDDYVKAIDDTNARFVANWEFFKVINTAAQSPQLVVILRSVLKIFPGITDATPGSPELGARWQEDLLRAVRAGDGDLAASVSESYAREAGELYIKSRA